MRFLFVTPAFPPFPGGGERYVAALADQLVQQGHRLTVLTSAATLEPDFWRGTAVPDASSTQLNPAIDLIRCPIRPFPGGRSALLAWRKLMVLFSQLPGDQTRLLAQMAAYIPPIHALADTLHTLPPDFDLVHGFNISWEQALWAGWQYAHRHRLPFVATPFAHLGAGHGDRVARNSTMDHQLHLLKQADQLMVLTQIEADGLAAYGVDRQRIVVIGGGVDALPTLPPTAVTRQKYRLPDRYLIFIGRASHEKGAIHAAQATLALRQQGQPIPLYLIGQQSPEFTRYYQQLTAAERPFIQHLGLVDEADKHSLLAMADLLLLPSRTDSFGIVFLEAWAHAVPVIGARAGGIPDVVDDGENGLLVEFGDLPALTQAIQRLIQDDALRHQMGQAGQAKLATQFNWAHVGELVSQSAFQLVSQKLKAKS